MSTLKRTISDRLHSAESAAELLGIKASTIRWWWTIGKLHRVKIGRLTRVRESELLTLIGPEHDAKPVTVKTLKHSCTKPQTRNGAEQ